MGDHDNGPLYNALAWGIAIVVSVLSLVLIGMTWRVVPVGAPLSHKQSSLALCLVSSGNRLTARP